MKMFRKTNSRVLTGNTRASTLRDSSDGNLVMASLGGDREAFCEIVTRYQTLLCSLAYSSIGDLKYSEDIAQEAFVEAWKKLDTLKDPVKLKSWLCGIVRFKVSHFRRKESKQPVKGTDELEEFEAVVDETELESKAINEQEQALLWKVLAKMPENYREPLVLFYREQRSVQNVAQELELSADVVKQRLSRGRKLLQKAMTNFVEDALEKSKPGVGFTLAVLASINLIPSPIQAAALSTSAAKSGFIFKWVPFITTLAVFSGLVSSFFGMRAGLDQSRTQRERNAVIRCVSLYFLVAIVYVFSMFGLKYLALNQIEHISVYAVVSQLLVAAFVATYSVLTVQMLKGMRRLRAQERIFNPKAFLNEVDNIASKQREYISRFKVLGVPLVHIRFGMPEKSDRPVMAWVAGGDVAYGLLFAWGGIAIAPISVGILSIGVLTVGAIGIGLIGLGTVAIGIIGFGASAIAYNAYASLSALGWNGAVSGGFSIAKEAAIGPIAIANQVNNEKAVIITDLAVFNQTYVWALLIITILVIVPAIWHSNKVRQRMRISERNCD